MKSEQLLTAWISLKDKIGGLVDRLNSQKEINEQIITNYQNKLKTKEETIHNLEEDWKKERDIQQKRIQDLTRFRTQIFYLVAGVTVVNSEEQLVSFLKGRLGL